MVPRYCGCACGRQNAVHVAWDVKLLLRENEQRMKILC